MVAKAAEDIGYDSVWVFERILFPEPATQGLYGIPGLPWPDSYRSVADPLVTLSVAAAATERVQLGTSVLVASLHMPFQLARALATLDNASGGRVVAGFGTGWSHDEYAAASVAPFERRGEVLDELLDVCAAVWGPDPVSFKGALTTIAPSEVGPKPARPIPVRLPATNAPTFRRVVDRADGWMPVALDAAGLAAQWQKLQAVAAERGRERPISVTLRANAIWTADRFDGENRQPFQGNVEQMVEDAVRFCQAVPVTDLLLDLNSSLPTAQQVTDTAAELHTALRVAGV
jgi:probable F420-dependent oxidoreductase